MNQFEMNELKNLDYSPIVEEISNMLKGHCRDISDACYSALYVLWLVKKYGENFPITMEDFWEQFLVDDERKVFLEKNLCSCWDRLASMNSRFNVKEIAAAILFYDGKISRMETPHAPTPSGINQLAIRLMDIRPGDYVADFCTGTGSFLRDCYGYHPDVNYYGNDVNISFFEIASIRAEVLGGNFEIKQEDMLSMSNCKRRFDCAFSDLPLGCSVIDPDISLPFPSRTSTEWVYSYFLRKSIAGPKEAIAILSVGATWNLRDKLARKRFLSEGSVKAVIALPDHLSEAINVSRVMVVFSHGNCDVMMVDAREMCKKGRRINSLTEENIAEICRCCREETDHSRRVSSDELKENDYILNPVQYLHRTAVIENGVPLGDMIKRITRGVQMPASRIDELICEEKTNCCYLTLGDIQDGIIREKLAYISSLDRKQEKYTAKNRDLILSKNGIPLKIAVVEADSDLKILVSGNLYIIEMDESVANPYYIQAFFESELGQSSLIDALAGSTIPNISVEKLKRIKIPGIEIEKQNIFAEEFKKELEIFKDFQRKEEQSKQRRKNLFLNCYRSEQ